MDKTLTNGKMGIGKSAILKAAQPRRRRHGDIFMVVYGRSYAEVKQRLIKEKAKYAFFQLSNQRTTFEPLPLVG